MINAFPAYLFMRRHAGWLSQADERILEFLSEYGNHQPKAIRDRLDSIGRDMEYHPEHISRECRKLTNRGLLVNVGGGTYSITEAGREFLSGELDAGDIDVDEE